MLGRSVPGCWGGAQGGDDLLYLSTDIPLEPEPVPAVPGIPVGIGAFRRGKAVPLRPSPDSPVCFLAGSSWWTPVSLQSLLVQLQAPSQQEPVAQSAADLSSTAVSQPKFRPAALFL